MRAGAHGRAAGRPLLAGAPRLRVVRSPVPVGGGEAPDTGLVAGGVDDRVHLLQLLDGSGEGRQDALVRGLKTFAGEGLGGT